MKAWYFIQFMLNSSWLFVYQADTVATYWISTAANFVMQRICLSILHISMNNKLSVWELIGLRYGFSIYAGWQTASTILNLVIAFADTGSSGTYDGYVGIIILWVAGVVYIAGSWWLRNPLYSAVLFWFYSAIADQ